jgi:hypothetical protein
MLLVFHDVEGANIYWHLKPTQTDVDIRTALQQEINEYNQWIENLSNGLAPLSAYSDPNEANQLYLAKHSQHQRVIERPGNRGVYERFEDSYYFSITHLLPPFDPEDEEDQDLLDQYDNGDIKIEPVSTLIRILTDPYDAYDVFSMGYRVLPMTDYCYKHNLFSFPQ